jgi:hypothetical protein
LGEKATVTRDFDWYLQWASTALLIAGALTTSADIIPLNKMLSFAGNVGWMWAGLRLKMASLWVVSAVLLLIYTGGIIYSYIF